MEIRTINWFLSVKMIRSYQNDVKLLYICTKIENLKSIKLNTLPVYDDKYIKTRIRWCRMWIFSNHFYWFFTYLWKGILPASIFRQLCLQNCKHTIVLDENLFETDED